MSAVTAVDGRMDLDALALLAGSFVTTEYASLTRAGAPVTTPVTPYVGEGTLDVSTGLTYPLKAERARRDPRVTLAFSDPTGSGVDDAPVVVVKGLATVRDADLVETSRRYLRESRARFPEAFDAIPTAVLARMSWYWARIWIQVTPVEVLRWPGGDLGQVPERWRDETASAPPSDPAPVGRSSGGAARARKVQQRVDRAVSDFPAPVLTVRDADGWPLPLRCRTARRTASGFVVTPPSGVAVHDGPANLTFHRHHERMEHQENLLLVGSASSSGDGEVAFDVERAVGDLSIPKSRLRASLNLLATGRALRPRLEQEAARRGARVPTFAEVAPARP